MENIKQDVIEEAEIVAEHLNKETREPEKNIPNICDPADETGCDSCQ